MPNELSNENLEEISGGSNALDRYLNTTQGRLFLAMCRKDVRIALNDKKFTNQLANCKNLSETKRLFDKRGVNVTMDELNKCYQYGIKKGFIK